MNDRKRIQTRRAISVSNASYERVKGLAEFNGISMGKVVERIIELGIHRASMKDGEAI